LRSSARELNEVLTVSDEVLEYQRALSKSQDLLNAKNSPEALQELTQAEAKAQKADLLESLEAKHKALIDGAKEKYKGLGNFGHSEDYAAYEGKLMNKGSSKYEPTFSQFEPINAKSAQEYEEAIRDLYGSASFSNRKYQAIVDGEKVNGIADNVTELSGKSVAIEAKFVKDWAKSIRNPDS
jgi:hypothetical protein